MKKIFILSAFISLVIFSSCKKELEVQGPGQTSGPITIVMTSPTAGEAISSNQVYTFAGTISAPKGFRSGYLDVLGQEYPITGSNNEISFSIPVNIMENLPTGLSYAFMVHAVDFDDNVQDFNGSFTLTQGLNASIISPIKGSTAALMSGLSGEFKMRLNTNEAPTSVKIYITYDAANVQIVDVDLTNAAEYYVDATDPKGSHIVKKSVLIPASAVAGTYDYVFAVSTPAETVAMAQKLEVTSITTLFVLGDATSAAWDINNPIALTNTAPNKFSKSIHLFGAPAGCKFVLNQGSWDVNWGTSETAAITIGTAYTLSPGGNNIMVADTGDYIISVDFETNTFKIDAWVAPTTLFLVGGSAPSGWDPALATPFTKISDGIFQIYTPLNAAGGGYKFLPTQGSWTGDWGQKVGEPGKLIQEGEENCPVTEDGFYRITVDFNTMTFVALKTSWGIIGDATINGWNSDTNMVYVGGAEPYTWELTGYTYTAASFKFRANDAWTVNFGDDGANGSLEPNGANIPITAGVHTVRMTLAPTGYTYQVLP